MIFQQQSRREFIQASAITLNALALRSASADPAQKSKAAIKPCAFVTAVYCTPTFNGYKNLVSLPDYWNAAKYFAETHLQCGYNVAFCYDFTPNIDAANDSKIIDEVNSWARNLEIAVEANSKKYKKPWMAGKITALKYESSVVEENASMSLRGRYESWIDDHFKVAAKNSRAPFGTVLFSGHGCRRNKVATNNTNYRVDVFLTPEANNTTGGIEIEAFDKLASLACAPLILHCGFCRTNVDAPVAAQNITNNLLPRKTLYENHVDDVQLSQHPLVKQLYELRKDTGRFGVAVFSQGGLSSTKLYSCGKEDPVAAFTPLGNAVAAAFSVDKSNNPLKFSITAPQVDPKTLQRKLSNVFDIARIFKHTPPAGNKMPFAWNIMEVPGVVSSDVVVAALDGKYERVTFPDRTQYVNNYAQMYGGNIRETDHGWILTKNAEYEEIGKANHFALLSEGSNFQVNTGDIIRIGVFAKKKTSPRNNLDFTVVASSNGELLCEPQIHQVQQQGNSEVTLVITKDGNISRINFMPKQDTWEIGDSLIISSITDGRGISVINKNIPVSTDFPILDRWHPNDLLRIDNQINVTVDRLAATKIAFSDNNKIKRPLLYTAGIEGSIWPPALVKDGDQINIEVKFEKTPIMKPACLSIVAGNENKFLVVQEREFNNLEMNKVVLIQCPVKMFADTLETLANIAIFGKNLKSIEVLKISISSP